MAVPQLFDMVRMTTTTTGSGTVTLGSATPPYRSFADAGVPNGALVRYAIADPGSAPTTIEYGKGVYTASGTTLTRVLGGSTTGSLLHLSGDAHVMITAMAEDFLPYVGSRADITGLTIPQATFSTPDGAPWIHGTSAGPMAIQDATAQWWEIDVTKGAWLEWFGCALDGVTDDSASVQVALNSGAKCLFAMSGRVCYCASGITIPIGVTIHGFGFIAGQYITTGFELLFGLSVATCVTLAGILGRTGCGLRGVVVRRAPGTPPAGSIGVFVDNGYHPVLEDVASYNHAIPFYFDGTDQGICCVPNRIYTGGATEAHVVVDNWPELRFNQCRFGTNGVFDTPCSAYIRFIGSLWNTVSISNCQFSQGHGLTYVCQSLLEYVGCASQNQIVQISDCYCENTPYAVTSDATTLYINKLALTNTMFNRGYPGVEFFNLHANTTLAALQLSGSIINTPFTLTPALDFYEILASGTWFGLGVTIAGSGTGISRCAFTGCGFTNNLTISGIFASAIFGGEILGAVTNTATTPVEFTFSGNAGWTSFTPALSFGTASVGITYTVQWGRYRVTGGNVVIQAQLNLSSKGSSTGTARLEGLPFTANTARATAGMGGVVAFYANMSALTGWPALSVNGGTTNATFTQSGAAATTPMSDVGFTNTSVLELEFMYAPA
jgi:hypothetical protein